MSISGSNSTKAASFFLSYYGWLCNIIFLRATVDTGGVSWGGGGGESQVWIWHFHHAKHLLSIQLWGFPLCTYPDVSNTRTLKPFMFNYLVLSLWCLEHPVVTRVLVLFLGVVVVTAFYDSLDRKTGALNTWPSRPRATLSAYNCPHASSETRHCDSNSINRRSGFERGIATGHLLSDKQKPV